MAEILVHGVDVIYTGEQEGFYEIRRDQVESPGPQALECLKPSQCSTNLEAASIQEDANSLFLADGLERAGSCLSRLIICISRL